MLLFHEHLVLHCAVSIAVPVCTLEQVVLESHTFFLYGDDLGLAVNTLLGANATGLVVAHFGANGTFKVVVNVQGLAPFN